MCVFTHLYRGAGIYLGVDQCHYGGGVVLVVGMSFLYFNHFIKLISFFCQDC